MRVVLDATPLLGRRTGIGRYAAHLLGALPGAFQRAGVSARLDVTTWTLRGGRVPDLPPGVRQVGPRVPARALRRAWARADFPPAEALVGRCDVVHGTNFVSPPTRHAREVVTVHDLTYELHAETVSPDSLAYRSLVRRALDRGAHVLTLTEVGALAVREFYALPAERVTAAPLGVDQAWADATPLDDRAAGRLGLTGPYLVFVGSLDPRKNLPRLVAAHAAASAADPDVPALVLAGPAGREAGLAPADGVLRTGWLNDDDLRRVVAGSAGLVLPSLDEGFGLPVLEALACGRPVLAADLPALREVAGDHAVYANPLDVDALAGALLALARVDDSPAARASRRDHAERWTWSRCADITVAAYRGEPGHSGQGGHPAT